MRKLAAIVLMLLVGNVYVNADEIPHTKSPYEKSTEQQGKITRLRRIKDQLAQQYKQSIRQAVMREFVPPSVLEEGATCTVSVRLTYPNEVLDVTTVECTSSALARTVAMAILSTDPFPIPPHKAVFERKLILEFKL